MLYCLILVTRSSGLGTEFEMLGSLDAQLLLGFTLFAFHSEYNLSGGLRLFVEDGLGLSTESHLFVIVTALALREITGLTRLVLCHLVHRMLLAFSSAIRLALLWNIDHD
jgi:hypothetical protein